MDTFRHLFSHRTHHNYIKTRGSDHDDGNDDPAQQRESDTHSFLKPNSSTRHLASNFRSTFLGLFLVIGILVLTGSAWTRLQHQLEQIQAELSTSTRQKLPPFSKNCGTSPSEARSRGCRFEMHNFAWVPSECYDHELGDEWDSNLNWGFSRSANDSTDTDEHFVAEARAGNVSAAWVPWRQHMAHCALILKKYLRSVSHDRPMDNFTANWNHAKHCTDMMLKRDIDPMMYNSLLHVKYPACDYAWRPRIA